MNGTVLITGTILCSSHVPRTEHSSWLRGESQGMLVELVIRGFKRVSKGVWQRTVGGGPAFGRRHELTLFSWHYPEWYVTVPTQVFRYQLGIVASCGSSGPVPEWSPLLHGGPPCIRPPRGLPSAAVSYLILCYCPFSFLFFLPPLLSLSTQHSPSLSAAHMTGPRW